MTTDELADLNETQRQVNRLKVATKHRHSLAHGTAEYDAAVKAEERLVSSLWRRLEAAPKLSVTPSE